MTAPQDDELAARETPLLPWQLNISKLHALPSEQQELGSLIDSVALEQAASVWKTALRRLETSFQEAVSKAADALTENPNKQTLGTAAYQHPCAVTDSLQIPSLPSISSRHLLYPQDCRRVHTAPQRRQLSSPSTDRYCSSSCKAEHPCSTPRCQRWNGMPLISAKISLLCRSPQVVTGSLVWRAS